MWFLATWMILGGVIGPVPVAPGEILNITVVGHGDPVVLIPGLNGAAYSYRNLVPILTDAGYKSVVIEPLGIGGSSKPKNADYSLTAQANRMASAMDALAVTRAVIVAHGTGASIALRLAYQRPDLVRGIVSLEGGVAEAPATPAFRKAMKFVPLAKRLGGVGFLRKQLKKQLIAASGDPGWVNEAVIQGYTQGSMDASIGAFQAMAKAKEPRPLRPVLCKITCPVYLLVGDAPHAGRVPPEQIRLLRITVRDFQIMRIPGVGHYIQEESPQTVLTAVGSIAPVPVNSDTLQVAEAAAAAR